MDKLIITVAPTGNVPTKAQNPHLPVTPQEIADTAHRCWQLGASIVHVHARDDQGRPPSTRTCSPASTSSSVAAAI